MRDTATTVLLLIVAVLSLATAVALYYLKRQG